MIRTTRKVLNGLLQKQTIRLDDESLYTLFCEVEIILNARPITSMSDDVQDIDGLTPNHLLLLISGSLTVGDFSEDNYCRKRWRQIQFLADLFWKRWKSEYMC